jgi:hypothetical protein
MNMRKTLSISPDSHQRLKQLARTKGVAVKTYTEQAINFFHQTGFDPEKMALKENEKVLTGLKKQVDFVVRVLRRIEQDTLQPMTESMVGLEQYLQERAETATAAYPAIDPLRCPRCQVAFPQIALSEADEVMCPQCDFRLPLQVGNVAFDTVDVYTLLAGGWTKCFARIRIREEEIPRGRFALNEQAQLKLHRA